VNKFCTIVTDDESWFTHEYQHSAKWSAHRAEGLERPKQQISIKKFMLSSVFWALAPLLNDYSVFKTGIDKNWYMFDQTSCC
jgi:hypothetical protein